MKLAGIVNFRGKKLAKLPTTKEEKARLKKKILYAALGIFGFIILLFAWYAKDIPTPAKLAKLHASESTRILAANGDALYETGNERRNTIEKAQMPDNVRNATVAVEDANFFNHHGVDPKGLVRALGSNLLHMSKSQGGSTITQQFVKNAVLTNEKSISRKIKELILSLEIEQIYNKQEILTMYLNEIPYGGNLYGIQEASQTYFGKDAKDLTLAESATLAAIPQSPTYYSPYGSRTDKLFIRKDYVLDRMVKQNYITEQQATDAKAQTPNKEHPDFKPRHESIKAPHFVMYVKEKLVAEYGEKMVDSGGLTVTTTLDSEKQKWAEEAIAKGDAKISKYKATNAAMVSVDVKTGEIVSMVGGKDFFDIKNGGNVNVTDSSRQPGSSFKPIVYATAFKQPRFSPSFNLFDVTTDFNGYVPQNYNGRTNGAVSMRNALDNSLNIPAVKTLALVGLPEALKTAKDLGITTLTTPERYGLSLVLGGGEVKPIEMAGAFAAFSDAGQFHKPVAILKVQDHQGKVLYEYKPETNKTQALDPQIAYEMSNVLSDNGARCMVFGCNNPLNFGDLKVAAKTGTTQEFHDAWTVGFTTKYSTAVWVGNNDNTKMATGADGSVVAAPIFHDYMAHLATTEDWPRPEGIQELTVEKYSNKLPTQYSKETVKDIFASWQVPTEKDNVNASFRVNKSNDLLAVDSTPNELIEDKVFSNIHNEWGDAWQKYPNWESPVRAWAQAAGFTLPPTQKDSDYGTNSVSLTSPTDNSTISNQVTFSVNTQTSHGISSIIYFLNDSEVGSSTSSPYAITFDTTKYPNSLYTLTAKMTDGNGVSATTSIKTTILNSSSAKISNVNTSTITINSATITFNTDINANSTIYYGTDTNYGSSKASGTQTTAHSTSLTGLPSGIKIYFKIDTITSQNAQSSFTGTFTTN